MKVTKNNSHLFEQRLDDFRVLQFPLKSDSFLYKKTKLLLFIFSN
jgi:hypothetical protein